MLMTHHLGGTMELTELSDTDLLALATTEVGCGDDDHDELGCLACQAWAVWESGNEKRVVR